MGHPGAPTGDPTMPTRPEVTGRKAGHQSDTADPARLIGKPEVLDRVGVSFVTIWTWMRQDAFPRGRVVGGKTYWLESEINEWILSRPVRRLKGDDQVMGRD